MMGGIKNWFKNHKSILATAIVLAIVVGMILFYILGTASGKRRIVDLHSNLNGGLERTINIYTANGDLLATYSGIIDLEANNGGYVKFDFEGKRYIYYNCFVESIAIIE